MAVGAAAAATGVVAVGIELSGKLWRRDIIQSHGQEEVSLKTLHHMYPGHGRLVHSRANHRDQQQRAGSVSNVVVPKCFRPTAEAAPPGKQFPRRCVRTEVSRR